GLVSKGELLSSFFPPELMWVKSFVISLLAEHSYRAAPSFSQAIRTSRSCFDTNWPTCSPLAGTSRLRQSWLKDCQHGCKFPRAGCPLKGRLGRSSGTGVSS